VLSNPQRTMAALRWLAWSAGALVWLLSLTSCGAPESPGQKLYNENCSNCHGTDGAGNTAQGMGDSYADLIDNTWKNGGDDQSIMNSIRDGSFGMMPAFRDKLTDEQIHSILRHLRTLRGERPPERAK
jgi:cytochrome c oxidase cbb3-type subunit 3